MRVQVNGLNLGQDQCIERLVLMGVCIGKPDRYIDRTVCRMLSVNETVATPVALTCFSMKENLSHVEQALTCRFYCKI
jgi:hypothetical protein